MAKDVPAAAPAPAAQPAASADEAERPAAAPAPGAEAPAQGDAPDAAASIADAASAGDGAKDDEQPVDWKAKYEDTETKRRDFQSQRDTAQARVKELEESHPKALQDLDTRWRAYIERNSPELYEKMTGAEQRRQDAATSPQATAAQSIAVINRIYRDGDKAFGDFLTTLVEDADARITPQSLPKHRATFDRLTAGIAAPTNGNGATPPATAASATPAPAGPPRIPSGGRPTVEAPPVWKEGQPFNSRALLSKGLADNRNRRGAPAPVRRT